MAIYAHFYKKNTRLRAISKKMWFCKGLALWLSGTKNLHSANAPFPRFSAKAAKALEIKQAYQDYIDLAGFYLVGVSDDMDFLNATDTKIHYISY